MKEELIRLLNRYEDILNIRGGSESVKETFLFSGIKPSSYYLPSIMMGSGNKLYDDIRYSWFVEIWIDGLCIYRQSMTNIEQEDLQQYEDVLLKRTMNDIFMFGLSSCLQYTKEMNELKKISYEQSI